MADQHHVAAGPAMPRHFEMHLGHQRAGGVEHLQPTPLGFLAHGLRDAVRAEDHRGIVGHFVEFFDEDRTTLFEVVDNEAVVHDFVPHIDRRAQRFDRTLDDLDRTVDTGTKPRGLASRTYIAGILREWSRGG